MKFTNKISLPIIASVALLASGCMTVKKAATNFDKNSTYTAKPEVLELRGDSVSYEVTLDIKKKGVFRRASINLNPVLVYNGKELSRPQVVVEGTKARQKNGAAIEVGRKGGQVIIKDKFRYQPEMVNSELYARPKVYIRGFDPVQDQCIDGPERLLAKGIVTTHELGTKGEKVLESGDPYKPVFKDVPVELYYPLNIATFNPNFSVKAAGINNKTQLEALKKLGKDREYEIRGITINGYASPEGEALNNQGLADRRATTTFNYLRSQLKKLGFEEANDSAFSMASNVMEDWAGWRNLVAASNLKDKEAILAILDSKLANDQKEARIKAEHAKSYQEMLNSMLPKLRRGVIYFNRQLPLKTDAQLLALGNTLDSLQPVELIQLARLYNKVEDKTRVYNHLINKYPEDWRGYNNLAMVQLGSGNSKDALANLEKGVKQKGGNNGIVYNNLGSTYAMMKNYEKAEEFYNMAAKANVNVDENLGLLEYRKGNYKDAAAKLQANKCNMNAAIAHLMNGDNAAAQASLECVPTENRDARYYYVQSVLGARNNSIETVTSNLTRSIQLDASFRERAKNDLEFRKVRDRAEFQNAIR